MSARHHNIISQKFLKLNISQRIVCIITRGCKHCMQVHCPILRNVPISGEKKWPVLVFSHGLGCSRFAYSLICTDLASHGFVVAAPEHRDGSGSITFHMQGGVKTWINHKKVCMNSYCFKTCRFYFTKYVSKDPNFFTFN